MSQALPKPDVVEGRSATLVERLTGRWGLVASNVAVIGGAVLALGGLFAAVLWGTDVVGWGGDKLVLVGGAAAVAFGVNWVAKGWSDAGRVLRWVAAGVSLALGASFVAGALSDPVVIDGKVVLSTSKTAKAHDLMQGMRKDLLWLAAVDEYLTFDAAAAGAHHAEYAPLLKQLEVMSSAYSTTGENREDLPAPELATAVEHMTSAAYWAGRAVASKMETITADNAKSQQELSAQRASYAEQVVLGGEALRQAAVELNIPLSDLGPTE